MQADVADTSSYLQTQLPVYPDKNFRRIEICGEYSSFELDVLQFSEDRCQLKCSRFSGQVNLTFVVLSLLSVTLSLSTEL